RIAYFETDPTWMKLAEAVLSELQSNEDTRILNGLGHTAKLVVGGTGVAGPVFMDNAEYREFIFNTWQADCLDMESTAIAHVCWSNATPFLIIRSLSDLAGGQKGINDIGEFHEHAEHNAARVLNAILDGLD
ncbi:MAG: 5'-methylthioadenosine/S-adenosylhomocysteine nucleosidase, partial [Verrucomicrobiae bacterium]|nr:5'-methylthioadenosine/S-adenosylhomocysteine nucleosidase [Verrucomicrobiae bacterium]